MKRNQSLSPRGADRFRTTRWSVVLLAAQTLIHRLRKQYTALVREEISCTVLDVGDVGAEIHELCEALIAAEGRVMM